MDYRELFQWVFVAGFIGGSVIRKIYTRHGRKEEVTGRVSSRLDIFLIGVASLGFIVPILYVATGWFDFADYGLPVWGQLAMGVAGTVVFALALWLLRRSHVDLGRNWAPVMRIRAEHSLVTGGVYSRMRHPMYAAHFLWGVAQILLLWNWIAGPIFIISFLPLYFERAGREERMMIDQFGDEYREYIKQTGRMWPRWK